jgi:hypothetical protein
MPAKQKPFPPATHPIHPKPQSPGDRRGVKSNFELFILLSTLALIFIMAARITLDTDMWWHLSAGKQIWTSGALRTPDVFSYTRPGVYWLDHSWLPDVGMYLLFKWGGYAALGASVTLVAVISMAVLWFQMEGSAWGKALAIILAGAVASGNWTARPQILTLGMMALSGLVLYRYKWLRKDRVWLLPILALIWANLHAGFLVLFMQVGLMLLGEILNHLLGMAGEQVLPWKAIRNLALWGAASALAVNFNPNGFEIWLAPFRQNVGVSLAIGLISEWASPDFHNPFFIPFLIMVFGLISCLALSRRRMDLTHLLTFIGFAGMALLSQRNMGVFAMAAAPILSREMWTAWETLRAEMKLDRVGLFFKKLFPAKKPGRSTLIVQRILNLVIFAVLVSAGFSKLFYATSPGLVNDSQSLIFPTGAVAWIQENKPSGKLFNSFNWGGYLTWNLPDYPVFIDGRVDPFGDEIMQEWVNVINADPGWENILDRWEVRLVLIEPNRPLAKELLDTNWKLIYADELSVLFGR